MPALDELLQQKLSLLSARGQRRAALETECDGVTARRGGKHLVSFSGNDYLGLSRRPEVIAAAKEALKQYGAGAGASRLVTGSHPLYAGLETALARHKGTEAACVFGSGYLATLGVIPALMSKGDLILADKLAHACLYDAARLSGANFLRFAHNNLEHCRLLLEANRGEHPNCLIVTETVFSMDGDLAPLAGLTALARQHDAWLMTDDAHGLGLLCHPERSEGSPQDEGDPSASPQDDMIRMGTLSKAAGSYGGYVCGSRALVDYLHHAARTLIYSTGLPPASVAASAAALAIMAKEPEVSTRPLAHARHFTSLLGLPPAQSAIVPLILRENDKALAASKLLEERGFLVTAIRPPTVPEHTARLRFAFSALHERTQIEALAAIIKEQGWINAAQA